MRTREKILAGLLLVGAGLTCGAAGKLKILIVDGQNNHDWKGGTAAMKTILERSDRFTVTVTTTPGPAPAAPRAPKGSPTAEQKAAQEAALAKWKEQKAEHQKAQAAAWDNWRPRFADFDVVLMNYTGDRWPEAVRADFNKYVREGGGLVIVHAADNAFPDWPEYNEMIAVGGWGGRNEKSGPMVRWRGGQVVLDTSPGPGGTHGPQHEFVVETREPEHPIMKGLPMKWRHVADELYSKLRGPAKNLTVLATAYADPAQKGTGEHEPILMTISYGKGRVFHTVLGHSAKQMEGLGFQITLLRGAEWAATGKVTLPPPTADELPADRAAVRPLAGGFAK